MSGEQDREALVRQQDQHRWIGVVSSRDGWSECECGARLPTILDSDGYAIDEDAYNQVMAEHRADAILASDWLADLIRRERASALREAAEELRVARRDALWFDYGRWFPAAMAWLRDRADREET